MKPRPYQQDAIDGIHEAFEEGNSTLLVHPTGTGKTIIFAMLINEILSAHPTKRAAVFGHTEELINQACDKIRIATGRTTEVEMADRWALSDVGLIGRPADVLVSSIQTQCAGFDGDGRMSRFKPEDFALQVVDEAHHSMAQTWRRVISHYQQNPNLKTLGVTATPNRGDEKALGQIFGSVAHVYEIVDAINDAYLVPIQQRVVEVDGLDLRAIRTRAGDLHGADLERALLMEEPLHKMVLPTIEIAGDRKTLVFSAGVAHAERMCEIFNREKANCARFVTGKTNKQKRREMFRDYKAGAFQFLVNVGVATEGFDEPGIQVVAMGRPTKLQSLYQQQIGRGTRTLAGLVDAFDTAEERKAAIANSPKPFLEVIDYVGNSGRHNLIGSADILGGTYDDDVIERAKKNARTSGKPEDVRDELDKASKEIQEELERQRRRRIRGVVQYSSKGVDPFSTLGLTAWRRRGWDSVSASEAQTNLLRKFKVPIPQEGFSKTEASRLIGTLISRRKSGLATFAQMKILKKFGYKSDTDIPFSDAGKMIDRIAANGWKRVPAGERIVT